LENLERLRHITQMNANLSQHLIASEYSVMHPKDNQKHSETFIKRAESKNTLNDSLVSLPELGMHRKVKIASPPMVEEEVLAKSPASKSKPLTLRSHLNSLSEKK
jgi:hypothetical protein